jgi:hypothetical protein
MKHGQIQDIWKTRNELHAEGDKHSAEGDELLAKGCGLRAEGNRLLAKGDAHFAEGSRLRAEGSGFRAEGDRLYRSAALAKYGPDVGIDWITGEIETK